MLVPVPVYLYACVLRERQAVPSTYAVHSLVFLIQTCAVCVCTATCNMDVLHTIEHSSFVVMRGGAQVKFTCDPGG